MKVFILRSKKAGDPSLPVAFEHGPDDLSLTVADLNLKEIHAARQDSKVLGVVPPMPLRLIQGLDSRPDAIPKTSWGVEAVGAARPVKPGQHRMTGEGVTVAVLDTGIDKQHPAFQGVIIVPKNFTGEGEDGSVDDLVGHGTHCAGTIFGRDVDGVRIGVAPGVTRALVGRVENREEPPRPSSKQFFGPIRTTRT
jgi:subtilisin family serine protease